MEKASDNKILFSIIICVDKNNTDLQACLESFQKQNTTATPYEIIVVDRDPASRASQIASCFSGVRYYQAPDAHIIHSQLLGIAHAQGEFVLFLSDAIQIKSFSWDSINLILSENRDVSSILFKILPTWETKPTRWLTEKYFSALGLINLGEDSRFVDLPNKVLENVAYRKDLLSNLHKSQDAWAHILNLLFTGGEPNLLNSAALLNGKVYYEAHTVFYKKIKNEDLQQKKISLKEVQHRLFNQIAKFAKNSEPRACDQQVSIVEEGMAKLLFACAFVTSDAKNILMDIFLQTKEAGFFNQILPWIVCAREKIEEIKDVYLVMDEHAPKKPILARLGAIKGRN